MSEQELRGLIDRDQLKALIECTIERYCAGIVERGGEGIQECPNGKRYHVTVAELPPGKGAL